MIRHAVTKRAPNFREVYDANVDFVWRYAAALGTPRDQVHDVAQEVFLVVFQKLSTFEGRSSVRTWVAGITINIARQHRRARRTSPGVAVSLEAARHVESPSATPEHSVAATADAHIVVAIIAAMTELQAEAFTLVDVLEMTAVEAALALGVNENTLRARLRNGRRFFNETISHFKSNVSIDIAIARALERQPTSD